MYSYRELNTLPGGPQVRRQKDALARAWRFLAGMLEVEPREIFDCRHILRHWDARIQRDFWILRFHPKSEGLAHRSVSIAVECTTGAAGIYDA